MNEPEFEVTIEEKHPLEILAEQIAIDIYSLYSEDLATLEIKNKKQGVKFHVVRKVGETFLFRRPILETILYIGEEYKNGMKNIVAYSPDENVEQIIIRHREQYMRENSDVAYFKILRNPKIIIPSKRGFS
ncbi:hypothetical protein HYT25_03250 [Candidatus Pacearchaeota archaeon]|nr:hypothetical protein [Candidatus Pacearchaeota archaeon]